MAKTVIFLSVKQTCPCQLKTQPASQNTQHKVPAPHSGPKRLRMTCSWLDLQPNIFLSPLLATLQPHSPPPPFWTLQGHCHLRGFTPTVPSAGKFFPVFILLPPSVHCVMDPNVTSSKRPFLSCRWPTSTPTCESLPHPLPSSSWHSSPPEIIASLISPHVSFLLGPQDPEQCLAYSRQLPDVHWWRK